jgi:hypothetical protein
MRRGAPSLLALASLLCGVDGRDTVLANHLNELLSLSELPLKNLLNVKRTFVETPQESKFAIHINLQDLRLSQLWL